MGLQTMNCHGNPFLFGLLAETDHLRVEKYRPVFLDDIVGNTETIERLKIIAKDGNMPHVIFLGCRVLGRQHRCCVWRDNF